MTEPTAPWPHARSSRDGIIAQFGASRAGLVGWALVTGDPLADAVVEEIHSGQPGVNAALDAGVRHGLGSLTDAPPAVAALLASTETRRVDDLFQAVTGPPIEESGTLAAATIGSMSSMMHDVINVPSGLATPLLRALVRRYHGDTMSDELRVPRAPAATALLGPAIRVLRTRRARLRQDAAAWQAAQEKNTATARELLRADPQPAAYEQQAAQG
jgi:hypothetical protein